jgi:peptide/nickel transport system substrate-binding protein
VLRPGLKWHDGQPVTAADCVASIRRWASRDPMGQTLTKFTASLEAADAGTIKLVLKEPYGLVLDSLGQDRRAGAVHDARAHRQDARAASR